MIWHWPQITYAILGGFGLLMAAAHDGEPSKRSFPVSLVAAMFAVFLLWQGGFWAGAGP